MRIPTKQLGHSNIGNIVELRPYIRDIDNSDTKHIMGTLEAIETYGANDYGLVIGGVNYQVPGDYEVDVSRSIVLQNLKAMWEYVGDDK